jgi:hypothetical protein
VACSDSTATRLPSTAAKPNGASPPVFSPRARFCAERRFRPSANQRAFVGRCAVNDRAHERIGRCRSISFACRTHDDRPGARRSALYAGRQYDVTRDAICCLNETCVTTNGGTCAARRFAR